MSDEKESASRQHEVTAEVGRKARDSAVEHASQALKSVLLINGGAAIAILAFVGGALDAENKIGSEELVGLVNALAWFAWGAAAAVFAMTLSFGSLFSAARWNQEMIRTQDFPYIEETPASKRWEVLSNGFLVCATAAGLWSLISFLCGIWSIKAAIVSSLT